MRFGYLALAALMLAALLAGCTDESAVNASDRIEIRTIENTPAQLKTVRKPPMIEFDEGPAPPLVEEGKSTTDGPIIASDEEAAQWTQNLPFSPKIAMDPVDGSKLSIRLDTPIVEYKGRIFYFSSDANRRVFIRSPDEFLSGTFASY